MNYWYMFNKTEEIIRQLMEDEETKYFIIKRLKELVLELEEDEK
jgi:hypothetical protein